MLALRSCDELAGICFLARVLSNDEIARLGRSSGTAAAAAAASLSAEVIAGPYMVTPAALRKQQMLSFVLVDVQ